MITINDHLLNEVKAKYPHKKEGIRENIYRIRSYNRYIQIPTPIPENRIHYEITPERIELHFEGDSVDKHKKLIDQLINKTENNSFLEWENWGSGLKCYCNRSIDTDLFETLETFIDTFDDLLFSWQNQTMSNKVMIDLGVDNFLQRDLDSSVEMYVLPLEKILKQPLNIPDYQRIYCWDEKYVKCLLDDLLEHFQSKDDINYRLGTIIFHHNGEKFDIIDGQQRLVTLTLLMYELGFSSTLLNEKFSSKESYSFLAYNKYLINNYCQKHLFFNREKFAKKLLKNITFSVLILQNTSIDLAYTFFSNTNSKGVSLTDYDLLKAHHLRFIPSMHEQQSKRAAEVWNNMIEDGRVQISNEKSPIYVDTLDMYLFHLRKWMRKRDINEYEVYRIKNEYEAAPIINDIPSFGERFYFNEPIQGGMHFFSYVELHLKRYNNFIQTEEYKTLHSNMDNGSNRWYRNVIGALLFGYYLKFEDSYLSDALVIIMRIILQHRYTNARAWKSSIIQYAGQSEIILMIDQATSPTFFLAETYNIARELYIPLRQDMKPIALKMRSTATTISKNLKSNITIESFNNINL